MDIVEYDCTLTYGTCTSFRSLYSFHINVYCGSYFTGINNQRLDQQRRRANHAIKRATGMKPSISHLCVLFFCCVLKKATAHGV